MNLWQKYGITPDTATPPMAMDLRHVDMLRETILQASPTVAVEIGSYKGHSTVAFIDAMRELPDMRFHIFEPYPTAELLSLVGGRTDIRIHQTPIWQSPIRPDFVFIDGDHGLPALADLAFCLARNVRTIAMHDTKGFTEGLTPFGSETAANLLCEMPDRVWCEDHDHREGEWTHRGFGVSTLTEKQDAFFL